MPPPRTLRFFGISLILIFTGLSAAQTMELKIRAREHFDTVWVTPGDGRGDLKYGGLGPNINIWMEEPFVQSFGLSFSFLFADAKQTDNTGKFGEQLELRKVGVEWKWYPLVKGVWFTRLGASQNTLDTKGTLGQLSGFGGYVGTGVEFNFSGIGLAFELAFRKILLSDGVVVNTRSPALGVHFYKYL